MVMARETSQATQNEVSVMLLEFKLGLPACTSLKEKRGQIKPLLARVHNEFNVGAAETGLLDLWQSAWITCAIVSNDARHNMQVANEILRMIKTRFPDMVIDEYHIDYR
jgi:hypothetical protein